MVKTSLHWLVVFSYITLFYGTIIPIMIADKSSSKSISNCVATGLPRAIFTTVAAVSYTHLTLPTSDLV